GVRREERFEAVKLAVSGAGTSAIEAHGIVQTDAHVVVRLIEADDRLEVLIDDRGRGFDPKALPEHPPVTDPERLNFERGLGIPLIRTLVDEVDFESGNDGTSVKLTIYCGRSKVNELADFE